MNEFDKVRSRDEIPVEDTWALEDLFTTDDAWEQELNALSKMEQELTAYQGKLHA